MEAVVFDMDGVIFDTERLVLEGWAHTGKKHGIVGTDEVCRECLGTTHEISRQIFLNHYGADFPYEEYKEEMRNYFYQAIEKEIPLKPGIQEILTELGKKNYKIGLASSTRRAVVLEELEKAELTEYFDVIIGGDLLKRSKPEPDIYLLVAEKLKVAPRDCLVFEDIPGGILAGKNAGMTTCAVQDEFSAHLEEEKRSLADYFINSFQEILKQ